MDLPVASLPTPLQEISDEVTRNAGVKLYIKRDDLIHPAVSGNKWRKLKYNLLEAKRKGFGTLLTFGGAFSNHLYATAAAGATFGFKTIGVVRGEEGLTNPTSTLRFCQEQGMVLHHVTRQVYKLQHSEAFLADLYEKFDHPFIIPEGGTGLLALKGVAEMAQEVSSQLGVAPDYYAVAAGTGGTSAGILSSGSNVLAFSALKGGAFLQDEIATLLASHEGKGDLQLFTDYHFGGYARYTGELLHFIRTFKQNHRIGLEQVYTGKMMFGLYDLMQKEHFSKGTVIVSVHTGGLQGLLPELSTP